MKVKIIHAANECKCFKMWMFHKFKNRDIELSQYYCN
jgi:dimeric dUTPase (all-alpha-NTP-PPase superfamily)